jgi:hypothetical protein
MAIPTVNNHYERLHEYSDPEPLISIRPVCYEPMANGLITPPDTSAVPSPLSEYSYPMHEGIVPENLSFMSHNSQDSDKAFVGEHQASLQMNYLLESNHVSLHDFEPGNNMWRIHPSINRYESDAYATSCSVPLFRSGDTQYGLGSWREAQELEQRRPDVQLNQRTMSYLYSPKIYKEESVRG